MVNDWVMDAWKYVATDERILDRFRHCGNVDFDGTIDKLRSKLRNTIKSNDVSYNLIKKVNVFTDEIK